MHDQFQTLQLLLNSKLLCGTRVTKIDNWFLISREQYYSISAKLITKLAQ